MGKKVKKKTVLPFQIEKTNNNQDLKKLLEVVSRGKYMWETTFDAIKDPVMIINEDYEIERANRAAADVVGIDIRKFVRNTCYKIFAEREEPCPDCPLQKTLSDREPHAVDIPHFPGDREFHVSSYLLDYKVTDKRSIVHHYRNVTEEVKLQRTIVQTEKMAALGMMAGGVAHEINNPLSGILAFVQLIQRDLDKESPAQEDLKEIENAALRCKKIVENLLNFSRQTKGIDRSHIDLNETVQSILPLFRLKLKSLNIDLKENYTPGLEPVLGNAPQLQQVILNVISNAADAMPKGGVVTIRTGRDSTGQLAQIQIQDTGMGIKKEDLNGIFNPYFTTKSLGRGTGLGLSISYNIIQEHGGKIEVKSEVNKGSTFTIFIPIYLEKERPL